MVGVLLLPVGLGFCMFPEKMFQIAKKMNKWIVTDHFFHSINKPRYKESYFYRHHRLFGTVIIIFSCFSLYILTLYLGVESINHILVRLADTRFEKWLFVTSYYLLLCAIILAVIFGIIMFIRPSVLKSFEKWSNHWIDTDTPLKALDKQSNLPDKILPGNPRIFGLFVIIGSIYIIWSTFPW
jgi:hypothetical protein